MSLRVKLILTGVLLCLTLACAAVAVVTTVQAFQRFQQARNTGLAGDVSSIRPWMHASLSTAGENELSTLLNSIQQYSYPALWITIFVAAIGLPLPIILVLLAAGAVAALGDFNIVLLFVIALSAFVVGDNIGYFMGRRWGSKLLNWLAQPKRQRFISPRTVERSRVYFNRQGGWAVFLSRFLFSALSSIINLLAGTELFPYRRFLLADIAGKALGASIPLALGYIFVASWKAVGDIIGSVSLLALALLVVIFLIFRLVKMVPRLRERKTISSTDELVAMPSSVPEVIDAAINRSSSGPLPL